MTELRTLLIRCFTAVFPQTPANEISTLAQARTEAWDSLATATLFTLVQEQFGIELDLTEIERLDSFSGIEDYLRAHLPSSSSPVGY